MKFGPLIERAAANLASIRRSTLDPLTEQILFSISLTGKSKVLPFSNGLYPNLVFPEQPKLNPPRPEVAAGIAASIVLGAIGVVSWTVVSPVDAAPTNKPTVASAAAPALADAAERTRTDSAASRSHSRVTAVPGAAAPAQKQQNQQNQQSATQAIKPVAGLTDGQTANATAVIQAGQEMNLPKRAFVVAIATTLQESQLHVLANPGVPDSLNIRNEGTGQDYDSVGLFQQRASMGWGTIEQLMDPKASARAFYSRLVTISGWEQMSVAAAAQSVQGSAFPDAYAKWEGLAQQIVDSLT